MPVTQKPKSSFQRATVGRPSAIHLKPSATVVSEGHYICTTHVATSTGGVFRRMRKVVGELLPDVVPQPIFEQPQVVVTYPDRVDAIVARRYANQQTVMDAICRALEKNPGMDQLDLANILRIELRTIVECIDLLLKQKRIEPA